MQVKFRPVLCQQCDNAPCEAVCPTYASHHTEEGLNAQVYNRCIGTRYCGNACMYNVRFFNFFNPEWEKPLHLQLNPGRLDPRSRRDGEVHVLRAAHQGREDRREGGKPRAGRRRRCKPACAQACPTTAIVFGDLNDPESPRRAAVAFAARQQAARGSRRASRRSRISAAGMTRWLEAGRRLQDRSLTTWSARCPTARCGSTRIVLAAGTVVALRRGGVGYQIWNGIGVAGHPLAGVLGLLSHQLRVLDRHQPRGHADLGDSSPGQRRVAAPGHALRGGHHGVRADDRRDVPDHPPRPAVAVLLADSVSEQRARSGRTSARRSRGTSSRSTPI